MPRSLVMGNGRLAVALDSNMTVRDFFYPQVGLENHIIGHDLKTGIWVEGRFLWLGKGWDMEMKYLPDTLVSRCLATHPDLDIKIETNDAVHHFINVFMRKVMVHNTGKASRKVRLFFANDFHIYGDAVGDTAMYEAAKNRIIHYKRQRYFLVDGVTSQKKGIYQFATGRKETFGLQGTWKDAEDGVLSGNPISQGAVDSVVSFEVEVQPQSTEIIYYWIACGKDLEEVDDLDARVKRFGLEQLILETENYWSAWVNRGEVNLSLLPRSVVRLFKTSLMIMRAHVDSSGAIIASCDSDILQFNRDTYSYVWPRDGAIAAMAFDLAGFQEVSRLFFQFCDRTISDKGFFHHKYSPDGSVGSSWLASVDANGQGQLPIQEDETALVLYALWRHFQKYRDIEFISSVYQNVVVKAADFLLEYIDHKTGLPKPSFDVWEEKIGTFTWTTATVCAALEAAAGFAKVFYDSDRQEMLNKAAASMKKAMITHLYNTQQHRFTKAVSMDGFPDLALDSSIAAIFIYGVFDADDKKVRETMDALIDKLWLKTHIGGLARYENDEYSRVSQDVPGNPWFISSLWLARWHLVGARSLDELKKGLDLLLWVTDHSLPSGMLAEQINPDTGAPMSVSPLVWSHAEFIIAVCEYLAKYQELSGQEP
ncbi:MAG: glycoside hydrolase family 15 protein [Chloroflexi bacterium]|nr:glycoside hydrolase family 15 protein [Chloroflexota bacterium]